MRIYAADFGERGEQLRFTSRRLPQLADWQDGYEPHVRVTHGRFDWRVAARPSQ